MCSRWIMDLTLGSELYLIHKIQNVLVRKFYLGKIAVFPINNCLKFYICVQKELSSIQSELFTGLW